ncbi:MAG: nucleic acid-binding protein [Terriglobia bacterium]|jgi:predicted nucleic acid-binding protein
MEAFDSTFLTFLFVPNAPYAVERAKERVDDLIGRIHGSGNRIVIPDPALAELLSAVGHSRKDILNLLTRNPKFWLAPFDTRAALELALMAEAVQRKAGKKKGDSGGTWAKVKFDWQIVAIAKVCNVSTLYSEDNDIRKLATGQGITVRSVADLPLPPKHHKGPTLFET